jgi:hypothetical protein
MSGKSDLESIRGWFNRIYIGGVPLLINDETAFLSFICSLTAIEALAGYRYPKGGPGKRFSQFIKDYFEPEYAEHSKNLWSFRNGMIHGFSPRMYAVTHHNSHLHLTRTPKGTPLLNAEDFYSALLVAARRYFADLFESKELQNHMRTRLQSGGGGGIGVGPVEEV